MTRVQTPDQYLKPLKPAPRKARLSSARDAAHKGSSRPKKASTYIIRGKKVVTTEVFDTFWWFAAERKSIYDKRIKGESAP